MMRPLLLIGGVDPTGEAGLARDIAMASAQGVHPCPVVTGLTVQTSGAFESANATSPELILAQAGAAIREHTIRWVKVGALFSASQIETVAGLVQRHALRLVLDPVLASSSGTSFLDDDGIATLRSRLLPLATLVTPNAVEATTLSGEITTHRAAAALAAFGAKSVLVKQGGKDPDLLFDGRSLREFPVRLQPGRHRGTGCRLSASIAALLAREVPLVDAVRIAHAGLQTDLALDGAAHALSVARLEHWRELDAWLPRILAEIRYEDVPEVGMNVAYALPGATDPRVDVLGLAGRITIAGFGRATTGRLAYGGPHHTGRIAVVLQELNPEARIVMNHKYDSAYIENAHNGGLKDASFRRQDEPISAPSTMEWGIRHAVSTHGTMPDLIWDAGGPGKEAMIRIIAANPADLVRKIRLMHHGLNPN